MVDRIPPKLIEAQNEVFGRQLYYCGLLAAAFHAKHGSVRMTCRTIATGVFIHAPELAEPVAPVEPHVWKQRAEEYFRVCDIPPDECVVVTRYSSDETAEVGLERRKRDG